MVELQLHRKRNSDKQVIGTMAVYKNNLFMCSFATLEQEWNNNKTNNSCIPKGSYPVEHYNSEKHPNTYILKGTEPRTYILIHSGNYNTHTAGCILIGLTHADINNDGYADVSHSGDALTKLRQICFNEEVILINII